MIIYSDLLVYSHKGTFNIQDWYMDRFLFFKARKKWWVSKLHKKNYKKGDIEAKSHACVYDKSFFVEMGFVDEGSNFFFRLPVIP